MAFLQYPMGSYAADQLGWIYFYAAPYSLVNKERTPEQFLGDLLLN
jgi:hypothetical protein